MVLIIPMWWETRAPTGAVITVIKCARLITYQAIDALYAALTIGGIHWWIMLATHEHTDCPIDKITNDLLFVFSIGMIWVNRCYLFLVSQSCFFARKLIRKRTTKKSIVKPIIHKSTGHNRSRMVFLTACTLTATLVSAYRVKIKNTSTIIHIITR